MNADFVVIMPAFVLGMVVEAWINRRHHRRLEQLARERAYACHPARSR